MLRSIVLTQLRLGMLNYIKLNHQLVLRVTNIRILLHYNQ